MSATELAASQAAPPAVDTVTELARLRAELDRLDDVMHDTLMQRAAVVGGVAALGAQGKVAFRPGREADILRRLFARHHGALPPRLLVRLWREIFAATTAMQGPYIITVCETAPAGSPFVQCAREHFGALTPLRVHRSPSQAIAEVSAGRATAAVLPMPDEQESQAQAWWLALLHRDEPRIHIVARLPFWAPRSEGAPQVQALVVAAASPDASSRDRTLIGLELPLEMSRARLSTAVAASGLTPGDTILRRDGGAERAHALVEVEGYVTEGDARLAGIAELLRPPVVLGAYAVPAEGESP
ncbi:MAG: chorismate mutase [Rhodospirillales bacterium]|nr:chorismate mutase [Rhodospirillales bacterium]